MSRWTALALASLALAVDDDGCGFDAENPRVWFGAAIPFALMGVAILVLSRVRRA
jgi:hypothetical protein